MTTKRSEAESSILEEGAPVKPVADLEGSDLSVAKAAHKNAQATMKAHLDEQVAQGNVRKVFVPSTSRLGARSIQTGVKVQINGQRVTVPVDEMVEVPNSVADVIESSLNAEKSATQREADFAAGRLVIPVGERA